MVLQVGNHAGRDQRVQDEGVVEVEVGQGEQGQHGLDLVVVVAALVADAFDVQVARGLEEFLLDLFEVLREVEQDRVVRDEVRVVPGEREAFFDPLVQHAVNQRQQLVTNRVEVLPGPGFCGLEQGRVELVEVVEQVRVELGD